MPLVPTSRTCSPCTRRCAIHWAAPRNWSAPSTPPTRRASAMIANFYDNILAFLHVHHDGEEKLIFPLLRERCPGPGRPASTEMAAQHADVVGLIERSEARGRRRGPVVTARPRSSSAAALGDLGASGSSSTCGEEERSAAAVCRQPLARGVGGASGPRHGELHGRQGVAHPRAHPPADDPGPARPDAGPHAAARGGDVDRRWGSRPTRTSWPRWALPWARRSPPGRSGAVHRARRRRRIGRGSPTRRPTPRRRG